MGAGGSLHGGRAPDGQRDPVGDVEAGVAAGLLDGTDQVALSITGSEVVLEAARAHEQLIAGETLATSYDLAAMADGSHAVRTEVTVGDGEKATVAVSRA